METLTLEFNEAMQKNKFYRTCKALAALSRYICLISAGFMLVFVWQVNQYQQISTDIYINPIYSLYELTEVELESTVEGSEEHSALLVAKEAATNFFLSDERKNRSKTLHVSSENITLMFVNHHIEKLTAICEFNVQERIGWKRIIDTYREAKLLPPLIVQDMIDYNECKEDKLKKKVRNAKTANYTFIGGVIAFLIAMSSIFATTLVVRFRS